MIALAGPHIVKFAGDSDSVSVLAEKLQLVDMEVLPHFIQDLVLYKSLNEDLVEKINSVRIKVLTLAATAMTGVFQRCS